MAFIQVCGRGTFKVSSGLKQFGKAVIQNRCCAILFDMRNCVGLDSTFMGVMAGLASDLAEEVGGRITVFNLSEKTHGLLTTLGLDQMVDTHLFGATPPEMQTALDEVTKMDPLETPEVSRSETAQTMLEAHENLVECSPENYPRFKDVLTFLREDLEQVNGE
jgi:hypothetical protein